MQMLKVNWFKRESYQLWQELSEKVPYKGLNFEMSLTEEKSWPEMEEDILEDKDVMHKGTGDLNDYGAIHGWAS